MANEEITSKDVLDMLTAILERTEQINNKLTQHDTRFDKIDDRVKKLDIKLENNIKPDLQAIRENQIEVINQKSHISKVETKIDEAQDDISVLKLAVQEHSKDIEQLKKRA